MQSPPKVAVFSGIGLFIVGTALFADEIGVVFDMGWGNSRIVILILGIFVALLPWIPWKRHKTRIKSYQDDLFTFPALLMVIAIYFWFISVSSVTTSHYYTLLITSFQQGELSLPLKPDPALLELKNPYDPAEREGIRTPLDISLYKGKFYLYWGPVPALLAAIVEPLFPSKISDGYLLLAFVCGIFLVEFLLIMYIWKRFFPEIPRWIVILSILAAGLVNPTLWLLSQARIYETAIAGGQFFFIAGLFLAFTTLDCPAPSRWQLALTGIFWSLAVGTRSILVLPVAFMTLMIIYRLGKLYRQSLSKLATNLISLSLPLIIGVVTFGWYNWARFSSISETGFSYALAGFHLQKHLDESFLPVYFFQNLYNYLLNPFGVSQSFPFLYPMRGSIEAILPGQVLPENYFSQVVTGIPFAVPFVSFAAVPVTLLLKYIFKKTKAGDSDEDFKAAFFHWIIASLTGSFLLTFTCLLFFFWVAVRYTEDFMPALLLLSFIGLWQRHRLLSQEPKRGKGYTILGISLVGLSIIIGILLALSHYFTRGYL